MKTTDLSGEESTATTDEPDISLSRIATVGLGDENLPEWEVYERAAWATQDTIERVACEEVA